MFDGDSTAPLDGDGGGLSGGSVAAGLGAVLDAFGELTGCDRATLDELVGRVRPCEQLSARRLLDRIDAAERLAHGVQAFQVRDLAAFGTARDRGDEAAGCPDGLVGRTAGLEVAEALAVAVSTGQLRVWEASRAVQRHPLLLELVGTGRVSWPGLHRVLAATDVLDDLQLCRRVDRQLAADTAASRWAPAQLERAAHRRVLAVDPTAADRRAAAARRRRSVRMGDPRDGVAAIFATLRAEEAWAVFTLLDRTARAMRKAGDERSLDTLMADLFVAWLTGTTLTTPAPDDAEPDASPNAGPAPASWHCVDGLEPWTDSDPSPVHPDPDPAPDDPAWDLAPWDQPDTSGQPDASGPPARRLPLPVEVQVVISAATLLGIDDAPGLLRGYGAVPASVIRDIIDAADTSPTTSPTTSPARTRLRALFCDPVDGRLIAMDSTARCFTGGLGQFALCRDQDSRLGGGRIAEIDHIRDHQHGGPTAAANAQALAKLPHILKDHPQVTVTALPPTSRGDGLDRLRIHAPDIEWRLPSGRTHTSRPPPALGPGSGPDPPPDPHPASLGEQHLARLLASAG
ncbi:MAG: DUF222 domain-containing protein [Nocardioidaceae bacterium]|nr:DUF222 domain-containing protein [Nocardioidaceae bacterium]